MGSLAYLQKVKNLYWLEYTLQFQNIILSVPREQLPKFIFVGIHLFLYYWFYQDTPYHPKLIITLCIFKSNSVF